MKVYKCDKCNRLITEKWINENELDELKELGHFTCSTCINKEMEENE